MSNALPDYHSVASNNLPTTSGPSASTRAGLQSPENLPQTANSMPEQSSSPVASRSTRVELARESPHPDSALSRIHSPAASAATPRSLLYTPNTIPDAET